MTSRSGAAPSRLDRLASHAPAAICAYFVCQLIIRVGLLPHNLEVDDAELPAQAYWALGYANSHPPLFSWIVRVCHDLLGDWAAALASAKYGLLCLGFLFVYDAARRAGGSRTAGALATACLFLIPLVLWKTQTKLTHSIAAFGAAAASVHAVVLVLQTRRRMAFAWLGLALSLGLLSKYNFALFVVALAGAVACVNAARHAFLVRPALITPAVALVLTAPHWLWVRANPGLAAQRITELTQDVSSWPYGATHSVVDGLLSLGAVTLVSVGPPLLIWGAARLAARSGAGASRADLPVLRITVARVMAMLLLLLLSAFALTVVTSGFRQVHERYLLALLPPFPVWLALQWPLDRRPMAVLLVVATAFAAGCGATVQRPVLALHTDNRLTFPYAEMADDVRAMAAPPYTIVSDRPETSANLAQHIPGARIYDHGPLPDLVLVVADTPDAAVALERQLAPAFRPAASEAVLQRPYHNRGGRMAMLTVQLWRRTSLSPPGPGLNQRVSEGPLR